jgi:hypothetical protein
MTSRRPRALAILIVALAAFLVPAPAPATDQGHEPQGFHFGGGGDGCRLKEVLSVTPVVASLGSYTPPLAPAATPVDITIDLKTEGRGTCRGAITFYRQALPARMTRLGGGGARAYTIQTGPTGGTPLIFASWPPANRTLDFTVQGGRGTQRHTVTLTIYVAAEGGWVAAGSYSDSVLMKVLDRSNSGYDIVRYQNFTVSSLVQQLCDLPPPDKLNLDFTSTISSGMPSGATLIATFSGVACSAPARIRLSGEPLINPAIPPAANFDNFIDWEASAEFGNAHVVLDTRVSNQATSAGQNVLSGATQSATITLSVRLLAGRRVIAGHYSNILTVTIDPVL